MPFIVLQVWRVQILMSALRAFRRLSMPRMDLSAFRLLGRLKLSSNRCRIQYATGVVQVLEEQRICVRLVDIVEDNDSP